MTDRSGSGSWVLVIDTATSRIVVAAGDPAGHPIRVLDWPAGHHHGQRLLPGLEQVMAEAGLSRGSLAGVVVGTGPGTFTGLRVGLATAKALAHAIDVPIVGVGTGDALLRAAAGAGQGVAANPVLLLPAGPHDRVALRGHEPARLLPGGTEPERTAADVLVAVDLAGRASEAAIERGAAALDGLAVALLELGTARLRAGERDDVALLVPEYVTLPRGVPAGGVELSWSPGHR